MSTIKTKIHFESGTAVTISIDSSAKFERNFTIGEMANNLASDAVKLEIYPETFIFMKCIQEFRTWLGEPMKVNSVYRTASFNKKCGGSSNSLHLKALAMDWKPEKSVLTEAKRSKCIAKWQEICTAHSLIGGANIYTHGFHFTAYEDKLGNKKFTKRDYRGTKHDW